MYQFLSRSWTGTGTGTGTGTSRHVRMSWNGRRLQKSSPFVFFYIDPLALWILRSRSLALIMIYLRWLVASAIALLPRVSGFASTDSPSDADPAQSGYLPNHNMDPAVVDSAQFGLLWKIPFNFQEQVSKLSYLAWLHRGIIDYSFTQNP